MARENNFLLGSGERLTHTERVVRGGGDKNPPYDFHTAKSQVAQWLTTANQMFDSMPSEAFSNDEAVAFITMHPRYVSKSEFPTDLLAAVGLRAIGGRSRQIKPHSWGIENHPDTAVTDEYFVAGKRGNFLRWAHEVTSWNETTRGAQHLQHIEAVHAYTGQDKLKSITQNTEDLLLEVVLHGTSDYSILRDFTQYATRFGAEVFQDRSRSTRDMTFVPVRADASVLSKLADFSYVRVVREMPRLRLLQPAVTRLPEIGEVDLPEGDPIANNLRVAIFDGGIPDESALSNWVTCIEPEGIGARVQGYEQHGMAVTSALLYGPIMPATPLQRPLCIADHIRVLDATTGSNGDFEYYDVLDRILAVLDKPDTHYDFINISLGPSLPVDDDDVTRWTSSLDERFAGDGTLVTVAAGNTGMQDGTSGLNRVQPPSDGVNVLSVGATDNFDREHWARAPYSSVGPGRQPGLVKPDVVIFGGTRANPFHVLGNGHRPEVYGIWGTSVAAPYALRTGIAIRTQLGSDIKALATRALMLHRADSGEHPKTDVGWGCLESDFSRVITCDDDEALVVYQDELPLGEYLRAPIPVPSGGLKGYVTITATLVIAPEVDPSYPNAYTRGGLEVIYRPNSKNIAVDEHGKKSLHAKSKPFFSQRNLYRSGEYELRDDAHKWEPCLKSTQRVRGSALDNPCFDIYYHHRSEATAQATPKAIPYALVISVKAPSIPNLYDLVVRTYANQLVQLRPQTRLQVR